MNRRITVKYCFLQGGYWTLAAVAMAFTTPLLEAKGFSGTEIGILSAVKYLAVLIFQMVLGSFADKHAEKVPLQRMLILMTFVNIIFSFLFYLTGHTMWMAMLTLIVFGMTIHCASPLVDSLSIQYMNHGVKMNYAISRACGSLCWAVFCVVVGLIADAFGANRILIFQIVVSFLFAFFAFNMDAVDFSKGRKKEEKTEDLASENSDTKCETGEVHSCFYLLKHFPKYSLFLLGLVFVFAAYNMNSTFLIDWIEGMGGNHADYGVAAMALGKGAYAIHQSGKWYTNNNIDQMLMERHLNKKARRSSHKNHIKGPKKRTEEDDVRFAQSFEKMLMMVQEKFQKNTKTMETGRKENK